MLKGTLTGHHPKTTSPPPPHQVLPHLLTRFSPTSTSSSSESLRLLRCDPSDRSARRPDCAGQVLLLWTVRTSL